MNTSSLGGAFTLPGTSLNLRRMGYGAHAAFLRLEALDVVNLRLAADLALSPAKLATLNGVAGQAALAGH
jgi:hypothetical protein